MATITWTDVTDIAPEHTAVPVSMQTAILLYVNTVFNENVWGDKCTMGAALCAAHMATTFYVRGSSGAGGPLIQEMVGQMQKQYANATPADTDPLLDTTNYGKMYRMVLNSLPGRLGLCT